jgi:hypothetical protein
MNIRSKEPPFFHLLIGSVTDLANYYERLRSQEESAVVMRLLRGEDMSDSKCFFAEIASAKRISWLFSSSSPM